MDSSSVIRCPICNLDLNFLSEIKRDEHCDVCLDNADFLDPQVVNTRKAVKTHTSTDAGGSFFSVKRRFENIEKSGPLQIDSSRKIAKINDSVLKTEPKIVKKEANEALAHLGASDAVEKEASTTTKFRKAIPFYKTLKINSINFGVDAFSYGAIPNVNAYFLTHFHSDHYGGLTKTWNHGPIYCSAATARLANLKLKVPWDVLKPLEVGIEYEIEGTLVKFFDANHCPGAVIIVFDRSILHTGDFRATEALTQEVLAYSPKLDTVYLDTTYLDPNRTFPHQDSVVEACVQYCLKIQNRPMPTNYFTKQPEKRRIVACVGSYTIGKERLAVAIAQKLNRKIWANPSKGAIVSAIGDPLLDELMCTDGTDAQVHLCSMRELNIKSLETRWKYLKAHFTHLIAFVPTGWSWKGNDTTFTLQSLESGRCTKVFNGGMIRICNVPYSEHSSYTELERFCSTVSCRNLISTVKTNRYDILRSWERKKKI